MKYKMINTPEGSGSSVKDFNVEDDLFYVTRGTYGGVKVTLVKFNNSNLEFCFKGIIDFTSKEEVLQEILDHDINNIFKIIDIVSENSYKDGLYRGEQGIKKAFRALLN